MKRIVFTLCLLGGGAAEAADINRESQNLLDGREVRLGFVYARSLLSNSTSVNVSGSKLDAREQFSQDTFQLSARGGVAPNLELGISLPIIYQKAEIETFAGIDSAYDYGFDNLTISADYQLTYQKIGDIRDRNKQESFIENFFAVGIRFSLNITLPTGKNALTPLSTRIAFGTTVTKSFLPRLTLYGQLLVVVHVDAGKERLGELYRLRLGSTFLIAPRKLRFNFGVIPSRRTSHRINSSNRVGSDDDFRIFVGFVYHITTSLSIECELNANLESDPREFIFSVGINYAIFKEFITDVDG